MTLTDLMGWPQLPDDWRVSPGGHARTRGTQKASVDQLGCHFTLRAPGAPGKEMDSARVHLVTEQGVETKPLKCSEQSALHGHFLCTPPSPLTPEVKGGGGGGGEKGSPHLHHRFLD